MGEDAESARVNQSDMPVRLAHLLPDLLKGVERRVTINHHSEPFVLRYKLTSTDCCVRCRRVLRLEPM